MAGLDIDVVKKIDEEKYWEVVRKIFHTPGYKRTIVIDFRKSTNPNTPKGLHICITDYDFKKDGNLWKIDIWFVDRSEYEQTVTDWLKDKVTDENKVHLLSLKSKFRKFPKYGKDFYSVEVYKAVIEHGARSVEDFKECLKQTGRSLE